MKSRCRRSIRAQDTLVYAAMSCMRRPTLLLVLLQDNGSIDTASSWVFAEDTCWMSGDEHDY